MNINLDTAKDVLCKNILIYGYCKYQGKGCAFSHNKQPSAQQQQQQSQEDQNQDQSISSGVSTNSDSSARKKYNIEATPSFTSEKNIHNLSSKFSNLSPNIKDAPVFKPDIAHSQNDQQQKAAPPQTQQPQQFNPYQNSVQSSNSSIPYTTKKFNVSTPSFTPSSLDFNSSSQTGGMSNSVQPMNPQPQQIPIQSGGFTHVGPSSARSIGNLIQNQQNPSLNPYAKVPSHTSTPPIPSQAPLPAPPPPHLNQVNMMNPNFFATQPSTNNNIPNSSQGSAYPLQYHLYAPAPPPRLTVPIKDFETNSIKMFIPNELRESLHRKNEASLQAIHHSNLPDHVNSYHSLVPIDKSYESKSKSWPGYTSLLFKCYSNDDGNLYVLRKIDPGNDITNESVFKTIKRWRSLNDNANIVALKDVFTTMAFNSSGSNMGIESPSLCFVYDYYPNSKTLLEHHKKGIRVELVTETILWNYLIQLVNAVKAIHSIRLSAGSSIDLSKIITTSDSRIKLSSCGISDVLDAIKGTEEDLKLAQLKDINSIGKVLLDLASTLLPANLRATSADVLIKNIINSTSISNDFTDVLSVLNDQSIVSGSSTFDLTQFSKDHLIDKTFALLNETQNTCDFLESQLTSELENARLFRLLTKLNFVINNYNSNMKINDKNNLKILKLFQHNLFNFIDSSGKNILNLHKVLVNLNKLDCGIDEKLLLTSEKEYIIVSYKELKEIVDVQFRLFRN
ncbi:PAN3 [Candida pseudojiufengensis]|uniref:PAN3 n=1 Tax=Candida pseudojiufengensis TaxID=497109 RepID=UPI0022254B18|nr:PAN3 [Candida pseudojiufengensis]KAI5964359.1 PAN3 [Candida pseudojiufengensis]